MDWGTITLTGLVAAVLNAVIFGFWKPWLEAYGKLKGENFARKEDLDKIVTEVKAITRTQEEIKSELAGDLWHSQTVWNEKKSIYALLLTTIHDATKEANELWQIRKLIVSKQLTDQDPRVDGLIRHHLSAYSVAETELIKLSALATLFANEESAKVILKYLRTTRLIDMVNFPDASKQQRDELASLGDQLIEFAKRDLGITA